MKCKQCRNTIKGQKKFCPECGNNLSQQNETKIKKPLRKKLITFLTLGLIIIIAAVAFYSIGKNKFTPENKIAAFEEAVKNNNVNELMDLISPYNNSFEVTTDSTAILLDYLKSNPQKYNQIIENLNQQLKAMETSSEGKYINYATLKLTKKGKEWLFFDNYKLTVIPAFIELSANQENIDFYIDNKKIATSSEKGSLEKSEPLMPGLHTVKGTFHNSYISSSQKVKMELFNTKEQSLIHNFEFDLGEVDVKLYTEEDYQLYINNKKTDVTLEKGEQTIGTFPLDGSIKMHAEKEYPWGTAKSQIVTVDNNRLFLEDIYVLTEEQQNKLMKQLNNTISEYYSSLSKKDVSSLKGGVSENLIKQAKKNIRGIKEERPKYTAKLLKAVYDKTSFFHTTYNEELDAYTITVEAELTFHEPIRYFDWLTGDLEKNNYMRPTALTVFYNEDKEKWILDQLEMDYFSISNSESKTFEF
ncbi:hypothetical protein CFK37_12130 [Virgibacillus phasianinus]|uniref:Zinc ribbon domain-containing protein n=1 Tax=Virgibacillus phasianinus TaxID=2017483 RepID=A0A220U4T2_9BACI|nr:hypothetical protein [Virgibacillus phasianinus]ASK62841.1 hypothetical protein CFK37_12130 [Virgibacillus phasianinus]